MASALVLRREINGSPTPAGGLLAYLRARQKILYLNILPWIHLTNLERLIRGLEVCDVFHFKLTQQRAGELYT